MARRISPSLGLDSRSVQPTAYSLYFRRLWYMWVRLHIERLQAELLYTAGTTKKSTRNKHTADPPAQLTSLIRILYCEKPEWPRFIYHTFLAYFYRTPDLFEDVLWGILCGLTSKENGHRLDILLSPTDHNLNTPQCNTECMTYPSPQYSDPTPP
jgi:hypothetical protein